MKKYQTIILDIKNQIKNGVIKKGDRLLTESQTAEKYCVSRITAQNAYNSLRREGLIDRAPGRGSFYNGALDAAQNKNNPKNIVGFLMLHTVKEMLSIVEGSEQVLENADYDVFIRITNGDGEHERKQCLKLIEDGAKGIIAFTTSETTNTEFFKRLILKNYPIIFVDRAPLDTNCNFVASKNFYGMYEIARAAINKKHKDFAYITVDTSIARQRQNGLFFALEEHGLKIREENIINLTSPVVELRSSPDNVNAAVEKLMSQKDKPDVIVCVNDLCAHFAAQRLKQMGFRIPDDVSVTGYDNAEYSRSTMFSLTTVDQNFFEIGATAAKMLLEYMNAPEAGNIHRYVTPKLILRNSLGVCTKHET